MYEQYETPDGTPIRTGEIVYASLTVNGNENPIYRYQTKDGDIDYFNPDGVSIRKALLSTPVADLSMIAELDGVAVGAVFAVPDLTGVLARVRPGTKIAPDRGGGSRGALINVGVLETARSRGIARAMAARSFTAMTRGGMRFAGYTLVLDDNWPSRHTAESLGARVTDNFVTYRRDF
jgi:ribosomal protein S18 acetylase RimI-like enzyme